MLILALVMFAVTAWFLGLRLGGLAAGVSFALLVAAQIIPGTALPIYIAHIVWIAGMIYLGPKVASAVLKPDDRKPAAQVRRWWKRVQTVGETLWRSRK